jgi:small subunit ribosomal protein S17
MMTQDTTSEAQTVNRKSRVGTVVSDKNDKTIVVSIARAARHRLYRKVIRRTAKYHVHDEDNAATVGDLVRIEECRPISRLKRWRLVEVLTEREVADVTPEALDQELVAEVQRSAARAQAEAEEAAVEDEAEVAEAASEAASEAAAPEAGATQAEDAAEGEARP